MGELSKKIGEQGEKLVLAFLDIIGWSDSETGQTLTCNHPKKHQKNKKVDNLRTTHGIDVFFSTRSHLKGFTLDNIVCSVKYTSKPYPRSNVSTVFRNHFKDLAQTLECFTHSELRANCIDSYNMKGVKRANDIGVLFWFSSDRKSDQDVISKVKSINIDKDLNFSVVHVVDNSRASFIYDSISFVKKIFSDKSIYFHYAFTSANYKDPNAQKYGKILPVEYLTSDILPFRLFDNETRKTTFCISCRDGFSEENLNRLINFSSDVSQDFTNDVVIIFPDYDIAKHEDILKSSKRVNVDKLGDKKISVYSYSPDFRNIINE